MKKLALFVLILAAGQASAWDGNPQTFDPYREMQQAQQQQQALQQQLILEQQLREMRRANDLLEQQNQQRSGILPPFPAYVPFNPWGR